MKLTVYGTRGSLPTPSVQRKGELFSTLEFGGNTTCYLLEANDGKRHIVDAGSGIRELGLDKIPSDVNLYISHTHWGHIQGFPFFKHAYTPGASVNIYGEAKVTGDLVEKIQQTDPSQVMQTLQINGIEVKQVFEQQQNERNFPAPLSIMQGVGTFTDFIPNGPMYEDDCTRIETAPVNHPGGCVSYKFIEKETGKSVVFCSDFEPDTNGLDDALVHWWKGANMVLADGQYERGSDINPFVPAWGHSDYATNVDLAKNAGIGSLLLVHHDPAIDDKHLLGLEERAKTYAGSYLEVALAKEGRTYEI